MYILYILIVFFFLLGIYNICIDIFKIPKYNDELKSFLNIFKRKSNKNKNDYSHLTYTIAKYIKIPNYFKIRLNEKLIVADINSTPELYIANSMNNALIFFFLTILAYPIEKSFSLIFIAIAVTRITKPFSNLNNSIKVKTEKIEREMPRFLDFMANSFKFNRNVKEALESYEKIAGEYLKSNIRITLADMSTGNNVNALKRLDMRINSYNFSKVIRAIIQVVKGDENEQYLKNLYRESASKEYEKLKLESDKKVEKVELYIRIIFICMVVMVATMLILMFITNSRKISGVR